MANGRLGQSVPNADTWTTLYASPANKTAVVTVNVCNIGDFYRWSNLPYRVAWFPCPASHYFKCLGTTMYGNRKRGFSS